jgi:hypothetical protein
MNTFIKTFCILIALALLPAPTLADTKDDEIDYLISSVGKSGCTFIRNGKRYSGRDARAHLKSKRRHNAHLIDSAEDFIEKLASKSSTSGKPSSKGMLENMPFDVCHA